MEDREIRKQKLQEEKDEIIRKIQIIAGQIIKDNGGHDIRFKPAEEDKT